MNTSKYFNILMDEEEKLILEDRVKTLWVDYLFNYTAKPLTKEWIAKKGHDIFWLGTEEPAAFYDFEIEFLPKYWDGEKVYQIDYFQNENFDIEYFLHAANRWRYFLPEEKELTYDSFYDFIMELSIKGIDELGWMK